MILSKNEILKLIKKKKVVITPFSKNQVGPASIDLTLGNEFRVYKKKTKIDLKEATDYRKFTEPVTIDEITLKPREFILGISKEKIKLPLDICGILTGRSRFARLGLAIHATASLIQPGVNNKQVFEITNFSDNELTLHAGTKICQLMLVKTKGKSKYSGQYAKQEKP
ncbi:MAG: dCTP deaminase [archaeon]